MYRLVLYYLLSLLCLAILLGLFGILPYSPASLIFSAVFASLVALAVNFVFANVFRAHTNIESAYITALILALIISPPAIVPFDWSAVSLLFWATVWAMGSKYIFAIGRKHVFNPAAFGVAVTALALGQSATWWAGGNVPMLPFVLLGGLLIVRKLRREDLVFAFFAAAAVSIMSSPSSQGAFFSLSQALLHAPIFFFAFVMLTEPLTTPPTRMRRIIYGAVTGLLFAPWVHVGGLYSTPELALLAANIFSYAVSPKWKQVLTLKEKRELGPNIYEFVFSGSAPLRFKPGQYLEWTLAHPKSDSRGNRRYFTVASSPTEREVRLGVKFYPEPSSFKNRLLAMEPGDTIAAAQLAGDFTMPRNKKKKLVFIAGGIGITPFRSMAKYLADKNEQRDVTFFYAANSVREFVYSDVFEEAWKKTGMKPVYVVGDASTVPDSWKGYRGLLNADIIRREVADLENSVFMISGPRGMVTAFHSTLRNMGIKEKNIKTDFFPGFA